MMSRRGFTLIELLITIVVSALIGTLLARMLVNDSRFVSRLEAMTEARHVARAGITYMSIEGQMVSSGGGVTEATDKRVGFVVPFAWGVACARDGGATVGSLIPADSMMMASAIPKIVYWLDGNGNYQSTPTSGVSASTNTGACQNLADTVRILPGGQLVAMTMADLMPEGSIFYIGEQVRYELRSSTIISGRWGLWREDGNSNWEELLAPFDSTSGFGYFVGINDTVNTNPPGVLSTITGIELRLVGESRQNPEGRDEPEEFVLDTRITFLNREE